MKFQEKLRWVLTGHKKKAIGSLRVRSSRSDVKDGMIRWLRNLNHQKKLVDLSPKSPTYFFSASGKLVVHFAIIHSLNDVHDNPMNHGFSWENLNRNHRFSHEDHGVMGLSRSKFSQENQFVESGRCRALCARTMPWLHRICGTRTQERGQARCRGRTGGSPYGCFNGGTPVAGWFISWKILQDGAP